MVVRELKVTFDRKLRWLEHLQLSDQLKSPTLAMETCKVREIWIGKFFIYIHFS